jgi:alpha-L-rhamnosidase
VRAANYTKDNLIAPEGPPVRRIEELTPIKILTSPSGQTIADMGQNMVGWVRLSVSGPAGTTVTLHHAEVLDQKGNFYTENLRAAASRSPTR